MDLWLNNIMVIKCSLDYLHWHCCQQVPPLPPPPLLQPRPPRQLLAPPPPPPPRPQPIPTVDRFMRCVAEREFNGLGIAPTKLNHCFFYMLVKAHEDNEAQKVELDELKQDLEGINRRHRAEMDYLNMIIAEKEAFFLENDVVIHGLVEWTHEDPQWLAMRVGGVLGVAMDWSEVAHAERVGEPRPLRVWRHGRPAPPRPLVVRFVHRAVCRQVLRRARFVSPRLANNATLGLSRNPTQFFVCEHLTAYHRNLFQMAVQMTRLFRWRYCWTKFSQIFVRQREQMPKYRIRKLQDLHLIFDMQTQDESANNERGNNENVGASE